MSDDAKLPNEVEYVFEPASYYRIYASNGAWGGMTPQGDLMIDFYVERGKTPNKVVNAVGKSGAELRREPPQGASFIRELQVGVLLSEKQALALAKFINERVAEFSERRARVTQLLEEKKVKGD